MMMAFGQFVFSVGTLAYQELQRQTSWRHPSNSRVGARPARQFVGPGDDTMRLSGLLAPEVTGTTVALDDLRAMADQGLAWPLVDGAGTVYGQYVIEHLNEAKTVFFADGKARRIEFDLQLARVDDERTAPDGYASASSSAAAPAAVEVEP